jgi:hypothetical protein
VVHENHEEEKNSSEFFERDFTVMNNGGLACIPGHAEKISAKDRLIPNIFW